ncbi:unnamed protein product [Prorocentrum cordatum]|uniref:Uncharacterized protein n=1 Tax=Prorocentrum cordatum TaxID=2364126 RepID=A0ABN9SNS5_9DINO|nr:unnamed protein product [Polarella glacialis]
MARNDEEDEEGRKPHKANLDDEFLKNPYSGASFRNPFLDRNRLGNRSAPIILQAAEYSYNSLDETLAEWKCVSVSEASLKQMAPQSGISRRSPLQRAALQRLNDLQTGFEFIVALRKSSFVAPRVQRRRPEQKTISGQIVDKLCIEVTDTGASLRVEAINEGLVAVWNRNFERTLALQVRPGDHITKANGKVGGLAILEEMTGPSDQIRLSGAD